MAHHATSLTSWARAIKAALDARDQDGAALFAEAGLDLQALGDPNARYPVAATTRLWELAVQATGDPGFGLSVAGHVNQTTFHALGYSLLASPTLRDAFERLVRYFRIVTDAADLRFTQAGTLYKFELVPLPGPQPAAEALDAFMTVIIRLCRLLSGPEFRAQKVCFRRPPPADTGPYEKIFKAPIGFAASETALYFSSQSLNRPLPTGNADLARHNDEILARYVAALDRENLANRVHAVLVEQLPHGEPAQEKIAAALHMSLRNLQRKLGAQGTSYRSILNQARRDLALSYLASQRYSISEIAYLLGFSDTSSFTRSFKRWTGMTPSESRDQAAPRPG